MLKAFHSPDRYEAGCDEAGRGCYAGPVFAAAVVLPSDFYHPQLNDSKLVQPEVRMELRTYIEAHALDYAVASVGNEEIDRINILRASFKAMHLALKKLKSPPDFILVDGHLFQRYKKIPHECVIKGDGIFASIAAASILAKTYRDDYMQRLHKKFPHYNWYDNKGYGTPEHRRGIETHGLCIYHRRSFNIVPSQMDLFEKES
ncbi:MAG TPA: ribonuclease HII [Puia sp.]|nr:ribonuclease HII [Puia sp.]